ncbi:peptidoglycan DD-metalloendopeptidase family protein [Pararobbsia alpina]|nr:peptidoglycan DD-metalloendopeptidase family protein [Pararobbsia alpina]
MTIRVLRGIGCAALLCVLAACGSAPVGAGYYRVERGDTLSRIAARNRTSVAALSRWNQLRDPNDLEVGQVLRVVPPNGNAPVRTESGSGGTSPEKSAGNRPPPSSGSSASASGAYAPKPPPSSVSISLIWPAAGRVVRGFSAGSNKGIDIAGSDGEPVVAAGAGTVVYAGDKLRGYGMLLIVKHNADFLTAYAHNRALLVHEGDTVRQGQKIAEMGNTDTDRMMLHFELRYRGTSIDPSRYLPPR